MERHEVEEFFLQDENHEDDDFDDYLVSVELINGTTYSAHILEWYSDRFKCN